MSRDTAETLAETAPATLEDVERDRGQSGTMLQITEEPEKAIARAEAGIKTVEIMRAASIRLTYPTDWLLHKDKTGAVIAYLQDCGAERVAQVWGIVIFDTECTLDTFPDGSFTYRFKGKAYARCLDRRPDAKEDAQEYIGARNSTQDFFNYPHALVSGKVDPVLVLKAAEANLTGRIVRSITGLNAVPLEVLQAAGLKTEHCRKGKGFGGGGGATSGAEGSRSGGKPGGSSGKKTPQPKLDDLTRQLLDLLAAKCPREGDGDVARRKQFGQMCSHVRSLGYEDGDVRKLTDQQKKELLAKLTETEGGSDQF